MKRREDRVDSLRRSSPSPTPSPSSSSFGSDPNISAIYPAVIERASSADRRQRSQQRFQAKHEPVGRPQQEAEINPEDAALQFVPALESARTHRATITSSPQQREYRTKRASSWDTTDDEKKEEPKGARHSHWNGSSSSSSSHRQHHEHPQNHRKTGRIARIASLFSSHATVQTNGRQNVKDSPVSPVHSSTSSSGYVGWPGTQDKRGATVAIQGPSFDDSSFGRPSSPAAQQRKQEYENELQQAAEREMTRWTGSYGNSSTPSSPRSGSASYFSSSPGRKTTERHQKRMVANKDSSSPPRMSMSAMRYAQSEFGVSTTPSRLPRPA